VTRLVVRRLLVAIPLIAAVTLGAFVLVDQAPGDPAVTLAGENPDPARVEQLREELQLDEPVLSRWMDWITSAARGDLGTSLQTQEPVSDVLGERLEVTLSLLFVTAVFAGIIGFGLGIVAALRPRGVVDRGITTVCSVGLAAPPFWIGLFLVAIFAVNLQWLPAVGYAPISEGIWPWLERLILPALALAIFLAAEIALQLKGSLTEVRAKDYVLTAEAKGLPPSKVLFKHSLKNAAAPVATVAGVRLAALVGGTATVETVFGLRGVGDLAVGATLNRDVSVMLGVLLISCVAVQVINLVVDISYGYFNPKVRT
jgi:peptide/nickel transport system permease protein